MQAHNIGLQLLLAQLLASITVPARCCNFVELSHAQDAALNTAVSRDCFANKTATAQTAARTVGTGKQLFDKT